MNRVTRDEQTVAKEKAAFVSLFMAGLILFGETLFGIFAFLGIGYDSAEAIRLDLCLTMGFPIFLLVFLSRGVAVIGLWLFFVLQWIDRCFISKPPELLNPLSDHIGIALCFAATLVTYSFYAERLGPKEIEKSC